MSLQIQNSVTLLYPKFYELLSIGIEKSREIGLDVYVFETYRSPERQTHLFHQKPQVTNSLAWMSWHQYALCADLVFGGPGKWSWKGDWDRLTEVMISVGLRSIGAKDPGHFELDHNLSIHDAKKIVLKDGIIAVWIAIESIQKDIKH